jgi:vacuolar-type H+-ATPase subunit E/Vma4
MSLEKIVSKVESDSKAAEQAILQEAARYRNEQIRQTSLKRDEILKEFNLKAEQTIVQLRSREEAGLEMEVKKRMLSSRKNVLDSAFAGVLEHFKNLPAGAKKNLYAALMARVSKEIPSGKIRHLKGEESLFSGFKAYTKGEPTEGIGGFIVVSADGHLEMDMRFEVLLKELWDRNLGEISAKLFHDGEKP